VNKNGYYCSERGLKVPVIEKDENIQKTSRNLTSSKDIVSGL